MWSHLPVGMLTGGAPLVSAVKRGDRVVKWGTVTFTRGGFARVLWDDGAVTTEWPPELRVV